MKSIIFRKQSKQKLYKLFLGLPCYLLEPFLSCNRLKPLINLQKIVENVLDFFFTEIRNFVYMPRVQIRYEKCFDFNQILKV